MVVILFPELNQLTSELIIGIVMALTVTIITSMGDVLSLYNSNNNTNPVLANTIGMLSAVLFLVIYTGSKGYSYTLPQEPKFWFGLLYLYIFASWLFYLKLISNIGASESGYMVAMFPAIGGGTSVLMGEIQISLNLVVGIVLACFGAYLALKKKEVS